MKVKLIKMEDEPQDSLHKTVRAAVYARYSSIGNSHYSADEQIQRIRFRTAQGQVLSRKFPNCKIEIVEAWVIKDEAKTGRVTREGYDLIKSGVTNKEFDVLLVDDISRLTRDMGETIDLYDVLSFTGVEGISISDSISTLDQNAKDIWVFKGFANEAQSKATSRNTIRGLEIRVIGGFSTGHNPYGYHSVPTKFQTVKGIEKPSHFEIKVQNDEANVVRRIWEMFADGLGQKVIARTLNDEGVPAPKKGGRWPGKTIHGILNQQKYVGIWPYRTTKVVKNPFTDKLTQQKRPKSEWLVSERPELRIISVELQQKVEKRRVEIHSKSKVSGNLTRCEGHHRHLFVGSLSCAQCGGNIVTVSGKGYMGCFNAHRETSVTCSNHQTINQELLEQCLLDEIWKIIETPGTYEYLAKQYNTLMARKHGDLPTMLENLELEIEAASRAMENFASFIEKGNASEFIGEKLQEAEKKHRRLSKERDYLTEQMGSQIYVTPTAIKKRLETLRELLMQKTAAAYQIIRKLLPEKIKLVAIHENGKKIYEASGVVSFQSVMENGVVGEMKMIQFKRIISKASLKPKA